MNQFELSRRYIEHHANRMFRRAIDDESGSATAEQIVMIATAVIGAAVIGGIIWQKMQSGADSIQTPAPGSP